MSKIRVGDHVIWRGSFGGDAPAIAKIESMQLTEHPRSKYGEDVAEADWSMKNHLVVTLTNGRWAYGEQLSPMQA